MIPVPAPAALKRFREPEGDGRWCHHDWAGPGRALTRDGASERDIQLREERHLFPVVEGWRALALAIAPDLTVVVPFENVAELVACC